MPPKNGSERDGGGYAELQITSNFSFLRGASHPAEYVLQAYRLGLDAIAITDRNTLAGIVRAHVAAKEVGIRLVVGARLDFTDAGSVLCFPKDRAAYGRLCRLLTVGRLRATKGECHLQLADLFGHAEGQVIVALSPEAPTDIKFVDHVARLQERLGAIYVAAQNLYRGDDTRRFLELAEFADHLEIGMIATNDVHFHIPERSRLQDVLTCIREGCTIDEVGTRRFPNFERHLKPPIEMLRLFKGRQDAVSRSLDIVEACGFSLDELKYEYPAEPVPKGSTAQDELTRLAWHGARWRYPDGVPEKVDKQIKHELELIGQLNYAPYFLTVYDIVKFAKDNEILCQGRGSAANSAVCFCLRITEVDPARMDLLFERFVSAARNEPPDIDVDFEHERREEVIQYIFRKYTRDRAGLTAVVISYRPKSAIRDVGKAMGLSQDAVDHLSRTITGWGRDGVDSRYMRQAGVATDDDRLQHTLRLAKEIVGFPRHLSQHPGGFVITRGPLSEIVPIENAAMEDRTVIQWDKDDVDAVGMLKIDVLALGMLTAIRKCFDLIELHHRRKFTMATIPVEDPAVYDMLCKGDSVGVFQVESRAQMTMLPRLKPRTFYDLVIEVAIVRPGPIQGDMVHPYLRRRAGKEPVSFPSKDLEQVLGKTLGVPLFQEQAMKIAIVAAGFTPEEADKLRRAMATFRHTGTISSFQTKVVEGMVERGYAREFAERCFQQIEGFGEYGFPESHAASFALLVYVSAWIKCHYPAAFACGLLNSHPMGFYAPAQLVRDARDHVTEVRPVDVSYSDWDCTLEPATAGRVALRLGFRQVKGFRELDAARLVAARRYRFATVRDAWHRSGVSPKALELLAGADAWNSLGLGRRDALWQIKALGETPLPLFTYAEKQERAGHNATPIETANEPTVILPSMPLGEHVLQDYRSIAMSLKKHPMALLRDLMSADGIVAAARLAHIPDGERVNVAGLVLVRQQPATASGVIFVTIEDETGVANIILWPNVFGRYRKPLLESRILQVTGRLQKEEAVIHVVAGRLVNRSDELKRLSEVDGEFERAMARADGVKGGGGDPRYAMPKGRNFK